MAFPGYTLPEIVNMNSARLVADDLLRHVLSAPSPMVDASNLRQAGVPLLQILVAAKRQADAHAKPFVVDAPRNGALATLLATHGLDPALCGAPHDLASPIAADSTQRT